VQKRDVWLAGESSTGTCISAMAGVIALAQQETWKVKRPTEVEEIQAKYFHNIEELFEKHKVARRKNRVLTHQNPKATIVITPSPEVGMQEYALCRKLDREGTVKFNRIGAGLQVYTPIVDKASGLETYSVGLSD
jgi:hypothetical protein